MNKNFQIILEKNKDFVDAIKNLLEKTISKDSESKERYKEVDFFRQKLVEGKLMKFFSSVALEHMDQSNVYLLDKQATRWTFSINQEMVDLIEVSRIYIRNDFNIKEEGETFKNHGGKFYIKHTKEKSLVEESMWNTSAVHFSLEFFGKGLSQEDIDLTIIKQDFDLSFLSKVNLEEFHVNKKNTKVFKQNYEKNFSNQTALFKKRR